MLAQLSAGIAAGRYNFLHDNQCVNASRSLRLRRVRDARRRDELDATITRGN
jgi:hypothetical protein